MSNPTFRKVFRHFWDSEVPNTDHHNEIVCLGITYDPKPQAENGHGDSHNGEVPLDELALQWPKPFLEDVESKLWLTYRKGFPLIPKAPKGPSSVSISGVFRGAGLEFNGFTSDVGWGCMIRTGQSLLANALSLLWFGRDWRLQQDNHHVGSEHELARLFIDDPSAPFSLHRFVQHGEEACEKMPGEWFGPSAAASSIQALCRSYDKCKLNVYISQGSDIYEDRLLQVMTGSSSPSSPTASTNNARDESFQPTLVLLCIRLGIDSVNPIYWPALKEFLACPQAVGIAGGRPSSSHYFYAYQGDNLFFLDPHQAQPALQPDDTEHLSEEALSTLHTRRIRTLSLSEMDPSMLVGFLLRSKTDWENWRECITSSPIKDVISLSRNEPIPERESSISLGSDDEGDFVDIGLDRSLRANHAPQPVQPVAVSSVSSLPIDKRTEFGGDEDPILIARQECRSYDEATTPMAAARRRPDDDEYDPVMVSYRPSGIPPPEDSHVDNSRDDGQMENGRDHNSRASSVGSEVDTSQSFIGPFDDDWEEMRQTVTN